MSRVGRYLTARLPPDPLTLQQWRLYGGFSEELLLRWGLMTLLVWAAWRLVLKTTWRALDVLFHRSNYCLIGYFWFGTSAVCLRVSTGRECRADTLCYRRQFYFRFNRRLSLLEEGTRVGDDCPYVGSRCYVNRNLLWGIRLRHFQYCYRRVRHARRRERVWHHNWSGDA
jgi:hypothetical protein